MTTQDSAQGVIAQANARTAAEAYRDMARYVRSAPEDAWGGPTGCARWTLRDLAGHVVGEAVWFPNLVRGVTQGEPPLPADHYELLKTLPAAQLAGTMEEAAISLLPAMEAATRDQLQQTVDVGFMKLPLWRATHLPLIEAVLHHWDAQVGRDAAAAIPTPWAEQLATALFEFAPLIANKEGVASAPGAYLLRVGDGVEPVLITADGDQIRLEHGVYTTPDVTLHLTADQYTRLLAGRLDLAAAVDAGDVQVEGERSRALDLLRIFQGI